MGALKIIAVAGGLAFSASALAADLPPPPMPDYAPAPLRGSIDVSGVYLRGDVGVGIMGKTKGSLDGVPVGTTIAYQNGSFGTIGFAGVGVGYQFNSWFRFDVTGEFRTSSSFGFSDTYTDAAGTGVNVYRGKLSSMVFLANAYVDLGNWHGLTPFLGAGAGWAYHKVTDMVDMGTRTVAAGTSTTFGYFDDKTKGSFAWALMAGVSYDVTPNVKVELGYRYLNLGKAASGNLAYCSGGCPVPAVSGRFGTIDSHDIKLGVRWLLNGPEYAPAPAPIVMRKG
jgi:opacity protein-like surface antigen